MSDIPNTSKTLEVKIRALAGQERQDQKDLSRVFLSRDALLELRLEAGQPCYLWKMDEESAPRREAIAWPSAQKLNKNVLQMFKTFQEICDFRLEDRIGVAPAGKLLTPDCILLRDSSNSDALQEKDRTHWEWFLEDKLSRAETIFTGMIYDVSLKGRRSFVVEGFMSDGKILQCKVARFGDTSIAKIKIQDDLPIDNISDGLRPTLEITGLAGIDNALSELNSFLKDFSDRRTIEAGYGQRECGLLIHGAHGTGKTLILDKICGTGWGKTFCVDSDTKPAQLREMFQSAKQVGSGIIVIDDIDSHTSKEHIKISGFERILGEEMDRISRDNSLSTNSSPPVLVVAATSTPAEIPRGLRTFGRFNTEVALPVPDADARRKILRSLAPRDATDEELTLFDKLGDRTHAYTPGDLRLVLQRGFRLARDRSRRSDTSESIIKGSILQEDIELALLAVRPSAMHDVTLRPPKVKWDQIGGQTVVKKALRRAVETPLLHPELIQEVGVMPKKGLLLYGPPGCSKTLSAQAMATESGFNFFGVKGAELLDKYVGESERKVRAIFARARAASPSIIFFDEIESIGSKRESGGNSNGVNVLTTLLNEMDGIETLKGVFVLAATNKPEALDLALLRPGRFDDLLYVAPPDQSGREEILQVRQRRMNWAANVDIPQLAKSTDGYSGAEIMGLCQAAGERVIDRLLDTGDTNRQIQMEDFEAAMKTIKKQITAESIAGYERWAAGIRN